MSKKIAVSMPGKTGDAIYAIPSIRYLTEKYGVKADFYTTTHVERARDLFEYQSCVDDLVIPHGYKIERYDMGIQPWRMPVNLDEYECVFHLGYRGTPNKRLDWFMAEQVGINPKLLPRVYYEYPDLGSEFDLPDKFYLLASNGDTSYKDLFRDIIERCPEEVYQIGLPQHYLECDWKEDNFTGLTFLETLYLMSRCSAFIGLQTNQLVLANGFDMLKIVPHDGKSWDMRHIIDTPSHRYLVNPTVNQILSLLEKDIG